ncbi:MAG: YceI family protein [Acidobacteria bacterium]|nr:YceI family protein [Acidobacteriota bacterium]
MNMSTTRRTRYRKRKVSPYTARSTMNGKSCHFPNAGWRPGGRATAAITLAALALTGAHAAEAAQSWEIASADIEVRCRLTVGGSFNAVTSALSGTLERTTPSGTDYSGELRVDLTTLDSGIELRDSHLRDNYLELERGPEFREAVLSGIGLDNPLPDGAGRHDTGFSGTLSLHGVERPIEGEVELRRGDGQMRVEATFSISLEAFDIPPPRYLGVGVRDTVEVTVAFDAAPAETSTGGTP